MEDFLIDIIAKAKQDQMDTLVLSEHIWHSVVTDGTDEKYLAVALGCIKLSISEILPTENLFTPDLMTFLMEQSQAGSETYNRMAIKLIHAQISKLGVPN